MDPIETPNAEMGTPSMGVKPKEEKGEAPKEEKKEEKKEEETKSLRFMTKSKNGNKIRVIGPKDQNRAQRRASERRFLGSIGRGAEDRARTKGAFGSPGINL